MLNLSCWKIKNLKKVIFDPPAFLLKKMSEKGVRFHIVFNLPWRRKALAQEETPLNLFPEQSHSAFQSEDIGRKQRTKSKSFLRSQLDPSIFSWKSDCCVRQYGEHYDRNSNFVCCGYSHTCIFEILCPFNLLQRLWLWHCPFVSWLEYYFSAIFRMPKIAKKIE